MKKLLIAVLAVLCLTGHVTAPEVESAMYIVAGHYYTSGEVITEDGNIWGYSQDVISEAPSYDDEPIYALMDDVGTPDNIYDDAIIGLVAR